MKKLCITVAKITVLLMLLLPQSKAYAVSIAEGITPVKNFDINKYIGKWYEIGRFDHSFQRGADQVTATYSLREDGGINVTNRAYRPEDKEWTQSTGRGYLVENPDIGFLEITFFWPFYGAYVVFDLDKNYNHALITGDSREYFWILSRTPVITKADKKRLLKTAQDNGFDTSKIIWANHDTTKYKKSEVTK